MKPSELFVQKTNQTGLYNIQSIDNIPSIMQRGLLSHEKSTKCAEVLVPYQIPYVYVVCAAVVNETAKQKLEDVGFDKEIVVKPNMFF